MTELLHMAASKDAIHALSDVPRERCGALECAICLDAAGKQAAAGWKETPCGHSFHGDCLGKWLQLRGTCPMCRHQLTQPGDEAAAVLDPEFLDTMLDMMEEDGRTAAEVVMEVLFETMEDGATVVDEEFLAMLNDMMEED